MENIHVSNRTSILVILGVFFGGVILVRIISGPGPDLSQPRNTTTSSPVKDTKPAAKVDPSADDDPETAAIIEESRRAGTYADQAENIRRIIRISKSQAEKRRKEMP